MGDEDGFDDFYQSTFRPLVGQLYAVTGDLHEAQDLAQESLSRAAARWSEVRAYAAPMAWVRRVAMNLAVSGLRRQRCKARALLRLAPPTETPPASAEALALAEALKRLRMPVRQAVVLHYLTGLAVQEIADELGVRPGTIKARLHRGRQALAQLLADDNDDAVEVEVRRGHG